MRLRRGFSFIELLAAITIIAIMAAVLVPRLGFRKPLPVEGMVEKIATLTQLGYEQAVLTGKLHRVLFDFKQTPAVVMLQVKKDDKGEGSFVAIPLSSVPVRFTWDDQVQIKNFYIKGIDEAAKGLIKDAWFFILPEGISQDIVINLTDHSGAVRALVLNPFTVRFTVYETEQTPFQKK